MLNHTNSEAGPFTAVAADPTEGAGNAYPLSPLQQGMLFHWQIDPHSGTDFQQVVTDLHETIDVARLVAAWQHVWDSHPTFRTVFEWEGLAAPQQYIKSELRMPFAFTDLRSLSESARSERIANYLRDDRRAGFDIVNEPAMRWQLFQLTDGHFQLIWSVHHLLLDGCSITTTLDEAFSAYDSEPAELIERPFREYIERVGAQDLTGARAFWKDKLSGFAAPTALPADKTATDSHYEYADRSVRLSREITDKLRNVAAREGLTLNTLLMGAWALMLSRYSGEQDIIFGATKSTRHGSIAHDDTTGVLLATVPVRLTANPDRTVAQWLQHVREEWVAIRGNEDLPLVEIRQASDVPTSRMFDTLLMYEHTEFGATFRERGGVWGNRNVQLLQQAGFPLVLKGYGSAELALKIEYDASRFSATLIDFIMGHLTTLLERWSDNIAELVWESSMLTGAERELVVHKWNDSTTEYPRDAFIDELFDEQALLHPDKVAVECKGESLTYRELHDRANAVALQLRSAGVKVDDNVVVYAERSNECIVAFLGVLKAGAAYLPIEPGYPKDRTLYMLNDADVRVVLTKANLRDEIAAFVSDSAIAADVLTVEGAISAANANESSEITTLRGDSLSDSGNRVAYIMYTSGSSGLPKGVAVPHRGAVRLVRNTTYMDFTEHDTMLGLATLMFDLSTWEIWSALLNGGRLVLMPAGPPDPTVIANLVEGSRVTMMWNTPALFQQLVDHGLKQYATVRYYAIAGDIVPVPHLRRAAAALPNCQFVNGYGPTENSVFTCAYRAPMHQPIEDPLPIGPPLSNSTAYVLDAHGAPTAVGVAGELFTGGDGVAARYVKRVELTAEKFVPDVFSNEAGATMYRTGDAARWRADGVVEFLGRLDNQVKIRGYRIEPGEVEAVMTVLPGVKVAAIAVRKDITGQKRLLGYFVPQDGQQLSAADVRTMLKARLPDYMIPAAIMSLPELPQTNSGKIDRKALPEPTATDGEANTEVQFRSRPLGRSQRQIAQIWEELLSHRPIGIDDDFFEIGGHSLLAVRMMSEVERVLGRRLALATLLEKPTIRYLARRFDQALLDEPEPTTVVLNENGTQTPFVFVHGDLTGGGWYCRKLATLIGDDTPMVVLPTFRPPESGDPLSIETMASMHLSELQKTQPHGPYRIGGFCAGGLIALEIAQQLKDKGETVEQLVLVDSVHENAPVSRWRSLIDRMAPPAKSREEFTKRESALKRVKYYDSRLRSVGAMGPTGFAKWAVNTVRIRLPGAKRLPTAGQVTAPKVQPQLSAIAMREREKLLFYTRSESVFVPRRYEGGQVDLVFSSDPSDQATNASDPATAAAALQRGYREYERGWHSVFPSARVHHIPGTHIGMIVENLDKLGSHLRSLLDLIRR